MAIKTIVSILLLSFASSWAQQVITVRSLESNIENTISGLNVLFGLIEEPIKLAAVDEKLDSDSAKGHVKFSEIELTGIKTLRLDLMKNQYDEATQNYKLDLLMSTILKLKLSYEGALQLFGFLPLFGQGDISLELSSLHLLLDIDFEMQGGHHAIKSLSTKFQVYECKFLVTGLNDNEEISASVSHDMSLIIPQLLKEKSDLVSSLVSPSIKSFLESQDIDAMFD